MLNETATPTVLGLCAISQDTYDPSRDVAPDVVQPDAAPRDVAPYVAPPDAAPRDVAPDIVPPDAAPRDAAPRDVAPDVVPRDVAPDAAAGSSTDNNDNNANNADNANNAAAGNNDNNADKSKSGGGSSIFYIQTNAERFIYDASDRPPGRRWDGRSRPKKKTKHLKGAE